MSRGLLLVVEDSPEDFDILSRAFKRSGFSGELRHCMDGDEALSLLLGLESESERGLSGYPRLVILDLNLPGTDGRAVLKEMKSNPKLRSTPVVVFTTSADPNDINTCYRLGANSYIKKPVDPAELTRLIDILTRYWFEAVTSPDQENQMWTNSS